MLARLQRFQDELRAINNQIRILKGRYSNQMYQIRESVMKFLDKETGTLGERIRTLFKEQGITIVSILTAVGMAIGARSEFWGGVANRVPSLQATLPPSPQIFSVISDTSCHTPYLFFKNTNCVTPPLNNLC